MMIKVHVRKGRGKIEERDGIYQVYTTEPFENNRANNDIIEKIAKHFNKEIKDIRIIRGSKSRNKIFEIK